MCYLQVLCTPNASAHMQIYWHPYCVIISESPLHASLLEAEVQK